MSEAELMRRAREIYEQAQDAAFLDSPLTAMDGWLDSGALPTAEEFRALGFGREPESEERFAQLRLVRRAFIRRFGFSLPCREAIDALTALGPLLEVGAGAGYWSRALAKAGADIVATDAATQYYGFTAGGAHPVLRRDAAAAVATYPERSVFCSWPSKGDDWLADALRGVRPGRAIAVVGEPRGGETGSDALFDLLDALPLEAVIAIPTFPRVRDDLRIYRKT